MSLKYRKRVGPYRKLSQLNRRLPMLPRRTRSARKASTKRTTRGLEAATAAAAIGRFFGFVQRDTLEAPPAPEPEEDHATLREELRSMMD